MIFNSLEFAIFLPIVFVLHWFIANKTEKSQNFLLLIASYFFYGWWDWRFLSLIAFSSSVDFAIGLGLARTVDSSKRKSLVLLSVFVNIGFLAFFKYFNFFSVNFALAFSFLGNSANSPILLNIILPVGISFYTFQTLSYTIDVYNKKISPTTDLIAFFSYVSFFPQLVAGPIERANNLLPQFNKKRYFNYQQSVDGLRQILWGLFKKMVIADNCAIYANDIFNNYTNYSGSTLLLGAVFFAFQIYGDFSGYSDIAIGTARIFGINLMRNFAFPYFSRDIAEFWRRWHISLSTWFRDYVYIPLGGSLGGKWLSIRNIFIIFVVSGFWHGANWTFIFWGALNAIYFLPLMLLNKNRENTDIVAKGKILPSIKEALQIGYTFSLTLIAWIFFRADSLHTAYNYILGIFSKTLFSMPDIFPQNIITILIVFIVVEWLQRDKQHVLEFKTYCRPKPLRWVIYYAIITLILSIGGAQQNFIYFQF